MEMPRPAEHRYVWAMAAVSVALSLILLGEDTRAELDRETADHVAASTVLLSVQIVEEIDGQKRVYRDCALGSGSVITSNGVILTNHHVLIDGVFRAQSFAETLTQQEPDPAISYTVSDKVGVWMVDAGDQTPIRRYSANIDPESAPQLDLAIARITGDASGVEYPDRRPRSQLEFLEIGDSDPRTWPTNDITIHGYPWADQEPGAEASAATGCPEIGGGLDETIQRTSGQFSGSERDELGEARLIYATGAVWFGNSGGSAVNDRGKLIGVPTRFVSVGGGSRVVLVPINQAVPFLETVVHELPAADPSPTVQPSPSQLEPSATVMPEPSSTFAPASSATPAPSGTASDPATPVSVTSGGTVIYQDTFDDPTASVLGTKSQDESIRQYRFENGEYVIEQIDVDATTSGVRLPVGSYQDVGVAVDARLVGETEQRYFFLICRSTEQGQYWLEVWPVDGSFTLYRYEDGVWSILASGEQQEAIMPGSATYRLELLCVGDEISARVNDTEIARVEDDNLRQGSLYLGTGRASDAPPGRVEAHFDNLEVTLPVQATRLPTTVDVEPLYHDDFNDPAVSWLQTESWDEDIAVYSFAEGEYVIEKLDPEYQGPVNRYVSGSYRDVVVTIDARLVGETERRYVVVSCRAHSGDDSFEANMLLVWPETSSYRLGRQGNEEWVTLAEGVRQDAIAPGGSTNRIELRCIGTELTAIINDTEIARASDETLTAGTVSFGVGVSTAGLPDTVRAHFDDLLIAIP